MNDECNNLIQLIRNKEQILREHLNCLEAYRKCKPIISVRDLYECLKRKIIQLPSSPDDPVRTKNLEKIAGHLHSILNFLEPHDDKTSLTKQQTTSLCLVLDQIKDPSEISSNNAWELSDLLEIELIRLGDDAYIYTLLKAQQKADVDDPHRWEKHFPVSDLDTLLKNYSCGKFSDCHSLQARHFLEYMRQEQVLEYRRDRAKAQLRGIYLSRMAKILFLLLFFLGYFYLAASRSSANLVITTDQLAGGYKDEYLTNLLWLVVFAGALGSVVSHAFKLGKQPLHAETDDKTGKPPLGIRALISEWKVFVAQPVIGASAALILFLIFKAGLLQIGGMKELGPEVYGLIAFLAGFSEAYFIGILDKVGGRTGSSLH